MTQMYIYNGEEFILKSLSPQLTKVQYRDQLGYMGTSVPWDHRLPYQITDKLDQFQVMAWGMKFDTIEGALSILCSELLTNQEQADVQAGRSTPQGIKAAECALRNFLVELPEVSE